MALQLIDRSGTRPVCDRCHHPERNYGIKVQPGRAYLCQRCLATIPAAKPQRETRAV